MEASLSDSDYLELSWMPSCFFCRLEQFGTALDAFTARDHPRPGPGGNGPEGGGRGSVPDNPRPKQTGGVLAEGQPTPREGCAETGEGDPDRRGFLGLLVVVVFRGAPNSQPPRSLRWGSR